MKGVAGACLGGFLTVSLAATGLAQESKSAALAKELAAALDAGQLDSIAAKDPASPDGFVGALYFKGMQLLVVSARYSAPSLLTEKLAQKNYRDVYIDLNSASMPDSKVFIEDLGVDGLKSKREENTPYDSYEAAGKRTTFDGDWKKQKISEQDYMKTFSTADDQYCQMLTALLAQVKKKTS